jgi:hypothetical protein
MAKVAKKTIRPSYSGENISRNMVVPEFGTAFAAIRK